MLRNLSGPSSSFWKAAGWFQQFAVPFAQGRGMEELTRWGPRPPLEALVYAQGQGELYLGLLNNQSVVKPDQGTNTDNLFQ